MARIIAVANQKGGVGKTTTAINLSASLAVLEKKILLIDADPQGNATSGCGIDKKTGLLTLYNIFAQQNMISEVILETEIKNLQIVPSTGDLVGAEIELIQYPEREFILKKALDAVSSKYDYIFIDCPPSLGLLTVNALVAAQTVLIPVQCEYYAMEGLTQLLKTIQLVHRSLNPALEIEGLLLTMFDSRNNLCNQVVEEVRKHFNEKVFTITIPRNIALAEAPSHGKPVLLYNILSKGAQTYLEAAKELITNSTN
ncbi:MAG: ParA family protein [Nitrospirae bacterium]|nr:ParA family protein [Nitrospirota bacterium]MBI3351960.1 ParA family protein [Nitrospirota bacterium]